MAEKLGKIFIIILLVLSFPSPSASGEKSLNFPQKPITLMVPYAVGSGSDIHARGLAPFLEKHLSVRVIIINTPGANGRIASQVAWKAAPDGYTVIIQGIPTPMIDEKLFSVSYKTKEFTHIFAWSYDNTVLVVNSDTWKTPQEFIAAAQAKTLIGGKVGGVSELAGIQLENVAKFKPVNWVSYSGGSEIASQLAGKHFDFGVTTAQSTRGLVDAGKLRPIFVFSNEKDQMFPNAPLPREVGLNFTTISMVRGVMAPPGLSPKVVNVLENAFYKAVQEPDYINWAKKIRAPIKPMNHTQFLAYTLNVEKEVIKYVGKMKFE